MFKTYYRNDGDNVSLFLNYSSDNVIRDNIDTFMDISMEHIQYLFIAFSIFKYWVKLANTGLMLNNMIV